MATAAATRPSGPVLLIPNYASVSPNRVKLSAARSPAKSVSVSSPPVPSGAVKNRRSCMCSPTNHPGSFRCSLHKEGKPAPALHGNSKPTPTPRPSAVVSTGCGAAEGEGSRTLARRAINPPTQPPRQRRAAGGFRPRPQPSRLSAVSFAGDRAGKNRQ
ncbi:uncharacterized protein LOC124690894 [Lolium rigidum]|uniref:uncharacterized protein LOC124690894 n=1 Tax=Lolium rigidum TaxID=89674 RepID=UPI001F5DC4AE|nr:uncharacterized protein LOC124690894 [Lolium rigidum]XP_051191560.1 uncharacterized protein LOC127305209 [Lolium perenne]